MKLAIIGSRDSGTLCAQTIVPYIAPDVTELVSGGASGIDTLAEQSAQLLNLPMTIFYPDYQNYGKKAPLIRNQSIVDYSDFVLAFWDGKSRGTAFTLSYCVQKNKQFQIIPLHEFSKPQKETSAHQ